MAVSLDSEKDKTNYSQPLHLIAKSEYRANLRQYLTEDCFKVDKRHILLYLLSFAVFFGSMYGVLHLSSFFIVKLVLSFTMGVMLASLTFFLHDLFHGSIIRSNIGSYLFGISIGVFNLFAPLFWKRVHNLHHARTGNVDDPDRSYILQEKPKTGTEKFAYIMRISNESIHPILSLVFMSLGFFFYFLNTMFYGLIAKKASIKEDKKYQRIQELFKTPKERAIVLGELIVILSVQIFLFMVVCQQNFLNYFLISLMPVGIAHIIAMSYIHTNHFLSPLTGEIDDPLINSLSIKDPWFVDKIFSNFSHHVEHHLFPAVSSYHYPKIRKLLLKHYPGRYKFISMIDAMKELFSTPRIYEDFTHLVSRDGSKRVDLLTLNS